MTRLMVILAVLAALLQTLPAKAQGGPPFLTTDPGTPGNGNWEINVGAAATWADDTSYQLPQLDVNLASARASSSVPRSPTCCRRFRGPRSSRAGAMRCWV